MRKYLIFASLILSLAFVVGCSKDDDSSNDNQNTGGTISGNVSGSLGGSYSVPSDLIVPTGTTLTLQPGTKLAFNPGIKMHVYGKLISIADSINPTVFTSTLAIPTRGSWGGLVFHPASDTSILKYTHLFYGSKFTSDLDTITTAGGVFKGLVSVDNANVKIERCVFFQSGYDGVDVQNNGFAKVMNCTFYDVAMNGIRVRLGGRVELNNSTLTDGDDAGLRKSLPGGGTITGSYNNVWNNRDRYVDEQAGFSPLPGDTSLNPNFADAENRNFHLTPRSFIIDKGNPDVAYNDPDHTRNDQGAYYYHQTPRELFGELPDTLTGTYGIVSDIWISAGQVCYMNPGTKLNFMGLYALNVEGILNANGTAAQPVTFTSGKSEKARGDWQSIYFNGVAASGGSMNHVVIEYASNYLLSSSIGTASVTFNSAAITVSYLTVREALMDGIKLVNGAQTSITNCTIDGFGENGLICDLNVSSTIRGLKVMNGLGHGVYVSRNSSPVISNALITDCGVCGIKVEQLCGPVFSFVTIADNVYHGISVSSNCYPTITNSVLARNGLYCMQTTISSLANHTYNLLWRDAVNTSLLMVNIENTRITAIPLDATERTGDPIFLDGYRLSASSPGHNAASDGSDMGAYGGQGLF